MWRCADKFASGLWRTWLGFGLLVVLCASSLVAGNRTTLNDVEAHIQQYSSLEALLADQDGLRQYRDLLKSYMGYNHGFDPIFEATVEQMRVLVRELPGFSERLWELRPDERIQIEGARTQRSGIEVNAALSLQALENARTAYRERAGGLLNLSEETRPAELRRLEAQLVRELTELSAEYPALATKPELTRSENRQLNRDQSLREKCQEYFRRKRELLESNAFLSYLRYQLSGEEIWLDIYRQPFAESTLEAITTLSRLDGQAAQWTETELGHLNTEVREALAKHSESWLQQARDQFEAMQKAKKELNALVTPREPAELQAELAQIEQQNPGITPEEVRNKLSEEGRRRLNEFKENREAIYDQKHTIIQNAQADGFFILPVVDERNQLSLEVRRQTSAAFVLEPMRGLHSAFGGYLTKECVGGACVEQLNPRRWALAALEGVRVFAAEKGGEFDGVLRLAPVVVTTQNEASGDNVQIYASVDMMIRSISDTIEIRSEVTGEVAKYPLFDAILDRLPVSSQGFIAGDGRAISQNTGLSMVYQNSPSVIQSQVIKNYSLDVTDGKMQRAINQHFPATPYGYNPGGMIYEGMPGDGEERFVLTPRSQRPRLTQEDLEVMILKDVILGKKPLESPAWSLAVENDVRLPKRPEHYTIFESPYTGQAIQELLQSGDFAALSALAQMFHENPRLAENPQLQAQLIPVIRSGYDLALNGIAGMFKDNPEMAKTFWQSLVARQDESMVRETLVQMFRNRRLREIFLPLLERTPEAEVSNQLRRLAREQGHRVARRALVEQMTSPADSSNPRPASSNSPNKTCAGILQLLHLQQIAR
ncbi:MAG: hypothetical protein EA369_00180 [Bradymonadales bacterium]|nr:MAG: hypothetical protein EA369_00180 [Bradymonadales bacterium]